MEKPILDVIVPCYNVEEYIAEALESLLDQSFQSFEIIVIDDASLDNTCAIVKQYAERDSRIKLISNEKNMGVAYTRNIGLSLCNKKYIAYMDADDRSIRKRFEQQIDFLERYSDIGAVSAGYREIDIYGHEIGRTFVKEYKPDEIKGNLLFSDIFNNPIAMFRRSIVVENDLQYCVEDKTAEDYRFWCRFSNCSKMYVMNSILYEYRRRDTSLTGLSINTSELSSTLHSIHTYMLDCLEMELEDSHKEIFLRATGSGLEKRDLKILNDALKCMVQQARMKNQTKTAQIIRTRGWILLLNQTRACYVQGGILLNLYRMYRKLIYKE